MVFNGIKLLGPMPVWCQVSVYSQVNRTSAVGFAQLKSVFHQTGCVSTAEWFTGLV